MEMLDFFIRTGHKILDAYSSIAQYMNTHGLYLGGGVWYSILDILAYGGISIVIGLIVTKWIIDFVRG